MKKRHLYIVLNPIKIHPMDLSDIQYLIELLESSTHSQDWDGIQEALEFLRESIEEPAGDDDDQD